MKSYILIAAILFASCRKETAPPQTLRATVDPSVTSVSFVPLYYAGDFHPKFTVSLVADSNNVDKVILYMVPLIMRWEIIKPTTGTYIMYDHISTFPTYSTSRFYYLSFIKKDGSVINEKPFQVY